MCHHGTLQFSRDLQITFFYPHLDLLSYKRISRWEFIIITLKWNGVPHICRQVDFLMLSSRMRQTYPAIEHHNCEAAPLWLPWTRQGALQKLLPRSSSSHRREEMSCAHYASYHIQAGFFFFFLPRKKNADRVEKSLGYEANSHGSPCQEWGKHLSTIPVHSLNPLHPAIT